MSARITKQLLKASTTLIEVPAKKTPKGATKANASVKVVKPTKKTKRSRHFLVEAEQARLEADNTEKNLRILKRSLNSKAQAVMQKILHTTMKK
ncbi:hypothetical protein H310_08849 [Aphanomyces invadans]|uniref:Uncharacterized protein n=1 Tax=Aphanomyces invadans TaxID=157072 RepID=A0A024TV99_9STRA|nr:hypothetical protein H310_08849 [Aphanomyces invadans]ETV98105.1 hypothetical protein H310_08849 [Aphanomyces invadans]|eukprot:XP_008872980.1 hypothetical protein H310_08849 [Aphanomyces invadans]